MGWLKDLLNPKKRFCCNENALRQRIAQKWEIFKNRPYINLNTATYAEYIIEHTPTIQTIGVDITGEITLIWVVGNKNLVLVLNSANRNYDVLTYNSPNLHMKSLCNDLIIGENKTTVEKINALLKIT